MCDIARHRKSLLELTNKINAPFFYYDLDWLQTHIKALQTLPVKLWYALKANPLSAIIKLLAQEHMRFDVASVGELDQVLKQGVAAARILHTGPAKSDEQLVYFIEQGVTRFVIESTEQLKNLQRIAEHKEVKVEVLLRVQLQWQSTEKNVLGGECVTPFGLSAEDWQGYAKTHQLNHQYVTILGFHCFQWGNILSLQKLEKIWFSIAKELKILADAMGIKLRVLDLGGGLGVDYQESGQALQLDDIHKLLIKLKAVYSPTEIWLELGRYAVAQSGVYVTKVIDHKTVYEREMLILEGGSQHLMRPTLTGEAFPVRLLRESSSTLSSIHLHGALCTSLDYLGKVSLPCDVAIKDHVVFSYTGAYGFTESMPFFLCHTLPAEVIYRQGKIEIVRPAQPAGVWLR
ncbi:PLP-dependent decarboxylase [Caedibacter taeniospiralis]|jgi:diaminopimelate decarboxylase|uniref:PLP-dependent decarboxylase n=1 Tax=Caedibacter taeniospiralis TaxID=28907 RepID=UPI0037BE425B